VFEDKQQYVGWVDVIAVKIMHGKEFCLLGEPVN
jgi:hypothetical protein